MERILHYLVLFSSKQPRKTFCISQVRQKLRDFRRKNKELFTELCNCDGRSGQDSVIRSDRHLDIRQNTSDCSIRAGLPSNLTLRRFFHYRQPLFIQSIGSLFDFSSMKCFPGDTYGSILVIDCL